MTVDHLEKAERLDAPNHLHKIQSILQDAEPLYDHDDELAIHYLENKASHKGHTPRNSESNRNLPMSKKKDPNGSSDTEFSEYDEPVNKLHDPSYFPDGGLQAWLCLLGGFFAVFTTWGIITSFGPFMSYYRTTLLRTSSSFQIGWISSVQLSCVFMGGVFTGKPFDNGYFYHLLVSGSILIVVMFMLLAECKEYYQVLLTQGVGMGLGMGMLFGPCLACTSAYFKKYRGLAMCVCSSGGGVGGIIFPIVSNNLLYVNKIGFAWTMRTLGFIELVLLSLMILVMRDRLPRSVRQKCNARKDSTSIFSLKQWVDPTALRSPEFVFFVIGVTCCFFGLYIPFAQIQAFAIHINTKQEISRYIVSILNTTSTFGRLCVFFIANYFGALNMTIIFSICSAITCYCWFTVSSDASMILFALFYGFLAGVVGTFPPFCVPHLTDDITKLGTRFGMCFFSLSLMVSFSIPIAGLCLGADGTDYKASAILSGSVFAAGAVFMCLGRISKAGFKPTII